MKQHQRLLEEAGRKITAAQPVSTEMRNFAFVLNCILQQQLRLFYQPQLHAVRSTAFMTQIIEEALLSVKAAVARVHTRMKAVRRADAIPIDLISSIAEDNKRDAAQELLGVPPEASAVEIKRAFKQKSWEVHPDRPGGSTAAQQELNAAFNLLNPEKNNGTETEAQKNSNTAGGATTDPYP